MRFFKKKLEDEESIAEIKDLKPLNRKLRKEPPKPWGKFERMVVLIALLFTIITALILVLYSEGYRLPKIDFDLNKLNILKSDTIIIERK